MLLVCSLPGAAAELRQEPAAPHTTLSSTVLSLSQHIHGLKAKRRSRKAAVRLRREMDCSPSLL